MSLVTQIMICNAALFKVGADQIQSIDQSDRPAVVLKALWDLTRDRVLRDHPWHFAVKRAALAPVAAAPAFEYDYAYDLPNDCIRVLRMDDAHIDWIIESGQILTDESTLNCVYIWRNTDPSTWDPSFADAFSWRLAAELAYPLTQSLALKQDLDKNYERSLALARSMNGVEGIMRGLIADTWTDQRLGNGPLQGN